MKGRFCALAFLVLLISMSFNSAVPFASPGICLAARGDALEPPEPSFGEAPAVHDPYEKLNREVFKFNDRLYFYVVKPVATLYAALFPPEMRTAVRNGFVNILFPSRFINSVLQGNMERAGSETKRFLINSTLGVGGLFDVTDMHFGVRHRDADFGQTLALWGANSSPFLMVPVLGPSNPRDLFGYAVDSAMDPIFWIPAEIWVSPVVKAGKVTNAASLRIGEYEDFKKASLDPYISMRDAYIQYREKQIRK